MGLIYAEIELINGDDLAMVRRNIIGEEEVKRMRVNALVDTGAYMLCINENIQEQLQLHVTEKRKYQMADGSIVECDVAGPIDFRYKNCSGTRMAMVLPKDSLPLIHPDLLNDRPVRIPYYRLLETTIFP